MRATLVDTGPLVALCDSHDSYHRRAVKEANALRGPALVGLPVLTEALHFLPLTSLRQRLWAAFDLGHLQLIAYSEPRQIAWAISWLQKFAEHAPDFADAHLVAWAASDPGLSVWTFDGEFRSTWRTLDGKPIRLARPTR